MGRKIHSREGGRRAHAIVLREGGVSPEQRRKGTSAATFSKEDQKAHKKGKLAPCAEGKTGKATRGKKKPPTVQEAVAGYEKKTHTFSKPDRGKKPRRWGSPRRK